MEEQFKYQNKSDEFVNPQKEKFWKLMLVFFILGIGFILLIFRLIFLQIVEKDNYRQIARSQHESMVRLKAERGDIYDRKGRLLATTVKSISYAIDPSILKDTSSIKEICKVVKNITGDSSSTLFNKIINSKKSFLWLVRGVSSDLGLPLDKMKLRGLIRIEEPKRIFLYGSVASQIVGCTDIDNNGLSGIELSCDSLLKGVAGTIMMVRDATGKLNPTASKPLINPVSGKSITLTIDIELQRIAENELFIGIKNSGSEAGSVIIQDPATGEILAMASYPTFDPNNMDVVYPGAMRNRAVTDAYEPGSTFKVITAAAAIEENVISKNDMVDGHNGYIKYDDYEIKDDHPTGKVKFFEAMERSSNVVFSDISYRIPTNYLFKYIRDFGFGLTYGIEIPGETSGKIKSPAQLDGVTKRFLGFGYSILVTPLQMVNAYSTIANQGKMMKPYIIKSISNHKNEIILKNSPLKIREVISESTALDITDMLYGVVENGTGKEAGIRGLKISGKTGTAQQIMDSVYSKQHYTASFAGYLPSDNPKLTIMVLLDRPKTNIYGGSTAAPIFRNIAQSWISVSRDFTTDVKTKKKNSNDNSEFVIVPDLTDLDAETSQKMLNSLGLKYNQAEKNFVVGSQSPSAGSIVEKNVKIILNKRNNAKSINVVGLTLRKALTELGQNGIEAIVVGNGRVELQQWERDRAGKIRCRLTCK